MRKSISFYNPKVLHIILSEVLYYNLHIMKTSFLKRLPTAVVLGLVAGLICTYLAAASTSGIW